MILIPNSWGSDLREFNPYHRPGGSPEGGQFTSATDAGGGGGSVPSAIGTGARLIKSWEDIDLVAAAQLGGGNRRFLFNPKTGEFVIGGAYGMEGRDQSHAEAFDRAIRPKESVGRRSYDRFTVHGHLLSRSAEPPYGEAFPPYGPLTLQLDRLTDDSPAAQSDALYAFVSWASRRGATKDTPLWVSPRMGTMRLPGVPLGKKYPELFKTQKKAA